MMKLYKYINEYQISESPKYVDVDGIRYINPSEAILASLGYKYKEEVPYENEVQSNEELYFTYEDGDVIKQIWKVKTIEITPPSLEELKMVKLQELTATKDAKIEEGFYYNDELYGFNSIDEQNMTQTNIVLLNMITAGVENPWVPYKPKEVVAMRMYSKEEFFGLVEAATAHKTNIWTEYNAKYLQLNEATTEDEINAITW